MSEPRAGRPQAAISSSAELPQRQPISGMTPENAEDDLRACAATSRLLLVAQRNIILCLRHETLDIDFRLIRHEEDIMWIVADTVSDRPGRYAVSYDAGNTAIVWDLHGRVEIARFAPFVRMHCAAWMKNGSIVFGNTHGELVMFQPRNKEHRSIKLIQEPITCIAPYWDCRTFAVGFLTGTRMIVKASTSFQMLHNITSERMPHKITGFTWHGSSSKSKMDLLASQTADGDMRVFSVEKGPSQAPPMSIRVLSEGQGIVNGPTACFWSKNGRIIQFAEREIRIHDVRTKNVVTTSLPLDEAIVGLCNHSSSATLFVMLQNDVVQQWSLVVESKARLVKQVRHSIASRPPSPPGILSSREHGTSLPPLEGSSASESERRELSPVERIARGVNDASEDDESANRLGPMSATSSRSSRSSRSSGRRLPNYLWDKPPSMTSKNSRVSGTEFPLESPLPRSRDTASQESAKSYRSSQLRTEVARSPDATQYSVVDLFPYIRARVRALPFRSPKYSEHGRTAQNLHREMLDVVFGWRKNVRDIIREEAKRQSTGSGRAVILTKWLGELSSDSMVSLLGSESMTSSDWMLLALSSIGQDSQRRAGEAFAQRLLEKRDIHPAVAILVGLGQYEKAIDTYAINNFFLEALLLVGLTMPDNWDMQCRLLRKWGEASVKQGYPELAARLFSCTSEEVSRRSPAAGESSAVKLSASSASPVSGHSRLKKQNASLKLITTFDKSPTSTSRRNTAKSPSQKGFTPIANSALSPGGQHAWLRQARKDFEPSSARSAKTATPGRYRKQQETPQTASKDSPSVFLVRQASPTVEQQFAGFKSLVLESGQLPSPMSASLARLRLNSSQNGARERMPEGLHLDVIDDAFLDSAKSPAFPPASVSASMSSIMSSNASPPLTASSAGRGRALEHYNMSLEQAMLGQWRKNDKSKLEDGNGQSKSREAKNIPAAKTSPNSPIAITPDEVLAATRRGQENEHLTRRDSTTSSRQTMDNESCDSCNETDESTDEHRTSSALRNELFCSKSEVIGTLPNQMLNKKSTTSVTALREDCGLALAESETELPASTYKPQSKPRPLFDRISTEIVMPPDDSHRRPSLPRFHTDLSNSPTSHFSDPAFRSQSVDPTLMARTKWMPVSIGLPANPRAMLYGRQMISQERSEHPLPALPSLSGRTANESTTDLPSSRGVPDRCASVPVGYERDTDFKATLPHTLSRRASRGHVRSATLDSPTLPTSIKTSTHQRSPDVRTSSIDETIHESLIEVPAQTPPLLPELQHLSGPPPPPPPPPPTSGTLAITLSPIQPSSSPRPIHRSMIASPSTVTRRARHSISLSTQDLATSPTQTHHALHAHTPASTSLPSPSAGSGSGLSRHLRSVKERMRGTKTSASTSSTISPGATASPAYPLRTASSYETHVLPPRAPPLPSSYAPAGISDALPSHALAGRSLARPGTAPVMGFAGAVENSFVGGMSPAQRSKTPSAAAGVGAAALKKMGAGPGYVRHPLEIRANMPPEMLKSVAYEQPVPSLSRRASVDGRK